MTQAQAEALRTAILAGRDATGELVRDCAAINAFADQALATVDAGNLALAADRVRHAAQVGVLAELPDWGPAVDAADLLSPMSW